MRSPNRPEFSTRAQPERKANVLWVTKLRGSERETFLVYSIRGHCFMTHWNGQATLPCYSDHSLCDGGHNEDTLRENWLLHAWSVTRQRETFLYLTPAAYERLLTQLGPEANLRGKVITVARSNSSKGRLHVQIEEHVTRDLAQLPPPRDPYESICAFLKIRTPPKGKSMKPADFFPSSNGHNARKQRR